jgi:hypothetical protein
MDNEEMDFYAHTDGSFDKKNWQPLNNLFKLHSPLASSPFISPYRKYIVDIIDNTLIAVKT